MANKFFFYVGFFGERGKKIIPLGAGLQHFVCPDFSSGTQAAKVGAGKMIFDCDLCFDNEEGIKEVKKRRD